jgi:hypothetical protein
MGRVVRVTPSRDLPPGMDPRYPLTKRPSRHQRQSGHKLEEKSFASAGDRNPGVQSVVRLYTDSKCEGTQKLHFFKSRFPFNYVCGTHLLKHLSTFIFSYFLMYFSLLQYILLRYKGSNGHIIDNTGTLLGRIHFSTAVILPIPEQV